MTVQGEQSTKYTKSVKYSTPELLKRIMGPNPVKPEEELLENHRLQDGAIVCDLGSGKA